MSENKESSNWIQDSLVGFIKGPVWNLSILNFIEQKSVIFDIEREEDEFFEQEYSKIYNEFKQMVNNLLSSHMEDLGISLEQLENACLSARENLGSKLHAILFEQIWAATNYRIFKRMMIQRNIDLQLQALELLGKKIQISKDTLNASSLSPLSQICEEEMELMCELFKKSLNSKLVKENEIKLEKNKLEEKDKLKNKEFNKIKLNKEDNKNQIDEKKEINFCSLSNEESNNKEMKKNKIQFKQNQFFDQVLNNGNNENNNQLNNDQKISLLMGETNGKISLEELKKRQTFLRYQRDKLIELKRIERSKQIAKVGEKEIKASRPKSANIMKASLEQQNKLNKNNDEIELNQINYNNKNLAYLNMIAARLKAELIKGSINDVINIPESNENQEDKIILN